MPKKKPSHTTDSSMANAELIRRYTVEKKGADPAPGPELRKLADAEKERYDAYWKALKKGEIPHSDAILGAFRLLENASDPWVKSIARRIKQRRILIVFEEGLSGAGERASGHLFFEGNRRPVFQTPGKKNIYALMNGVIKINAGYSRSYITTAAVLAHELWHVIDKERRGNDLPDLEPLQIDPYDKNLTLSGVEDWADYAAGRTVWALGYTMDIIENGKRGKRLGWGPDFQNNKDHELQKLNHFLAADKALAKRGAIRCGAPCRTKEGPCNNPVYVPPCHYH